MHEMQGPVHLPSQTTPLPRMWADFLQPLQFLSCRCALHILKPTRVCVGCFIQQTVPQIRQLPDGAEEEEKQPERPARDGTEPAAISANERIAERIMLLFVQELQQQVDQEHERQHQTAEQQQQAQAQRYAARPAVAVEPPSECVASTSRPL
jgi:hypothetical protein